MAYIAGAYTATYNGMTVGEASSGFTLRYTVRKRLITGDNHARTPQDAVYQGHDFFVQFVLNEFDATAAQAAFWPYDASFGDNGVVGVLDSAKYKAFVLTPVSGTSATLTYTFDRTILAEDFPVEILKAPDLKEVPMLLRAYPNASQQFFAAA